MTDAPHTATMNRPGAHTAAGASRLSLAGRGQVNAAVRVLAALAGFYATLSVMHLLVLHGTARIVMVALAAGSAATLAAAAAFIRRRRRDTPTVWTQGFAVIPIANSLVNVAVTGDLHQSATLMLALVGVGAMVTSARIAAGVGLVGCLGWAALVTARPALRTPELVHYAMQLAMAALLATLLHAVLTRRQNHLRAAGDERAAVAHRFVSIFEASPVGISLADEHGRIVAVNPALCRLLDRPATELLGTSSLQYTHPDDQPDRADAHQLITHTDDITQVEQRFVRPDGSIRWAWSTFSRTTPVDMATGTSCDDSETASDRRDWTLAHVQDVTERRLAEQSLRDSEHNLAAVAAVARRIRTGEDARTSIVTAAQHLAGADTVALIEPADTGSDGDATGEPTELVITAAAGSDVLGTRVPLTATSMTVHVYRSGQPVFLADPTTEPMVSPALLALSGARSMMWQPIIVKGQVTAVLAVTWNQPVRTISDQRAAAVALLADEAALALDHERLLRRLEQMAHTDSLTGLANRRAWQTQLPRILAHARRTGRPITVAIVDLDHFKRYNDTHGHPAGDQLLRRVAAAFTAKVRDSDLVARWGGEEFAIALPDCPPARAAMVLDRVRTAVPENQTCSIGYASWDTIETDDDLLARADAALYRAKAGGRNIACSAPATLST